MQSFPQCKILPKILFYQLYISPCTTAITYQENVTTVEVFKGHLDSAVSDKTQEPADYNLLWIPYVVIGMSILLIFLASFLHYRRVHREKYARRRMQQEINALDKSIQMQVIWDMVLTDDLLTDEEKVEKVIDILGVREKKWKIVGRNKSRPIAPHNGLHEVVHHPTSSFSNPNLIFQKARQYH